MTASDSETVLVGDVLPEVVFGPISRAMLALYAGASGDHNPVHIDIDFARRAKLPDVFAQGMLSFGVLAQVATRWVGVAGVLEVGGRFLALTQVGDHVTFRGTVIERAAGEGGEPLARIQITATTDDGRETLSGDALVALHL